MVLNSGYLGYIGGLLGGLGILILIVTVAVIFRNVTLTIGPKQKRGASACHIVLIYRNARETICTYSNSTLVRQLCLDR